MSGVPSMRARRLLGAKTTCKCNWIITLGGSLLVAAMIMCASIGDARAKSSAAALCLPPAYLNSPLVVAKCSAAQSLASRFDNLPTLAILKARAQSRTLRDVTGGVLDLRLDVVPPKPILLTTLVSLPSLAPPTTVPAPIVDDGGLAPAMIVGIASMYDPIGLDKKDPDSLETASGELYDQTAWTAAIRTDLRTRFEGVRFGINYKPAFALVETGNKRAIVRVNDVGPLAPGRVIDLNLRSMEYFDPTLELGLLKDVHVTPLPGTHWTPGPVDGNDERILVGSLEP
jgi:rare lipoprotein A